MTREELLDMICPSDSIADCCSEECLFGCNDCKITMGYMFDDYDKQIRADAIDEFVNLVKQHNWNIDGKNQDEFIYGAIDYLAERLKEKADE